MTFTSRRRFTLGSLVCLRVLLVKVLNSFSEESTAAPQVFLNSKQSKPRSVGERVLTNKESSVSYQKHVIRWAHKLAHKNVLNVQLKHGCSANFSEEI